MHELDSAVGFEKFNEPARCARRRPFINAANEIGYTFNWFYTDNKHIAYFNSGLNPVRAPHTDPLFPTWSQLRVARPDAGRGDDSEQPDRARHRRGRASAGGRSACADQLEQQAGAGLRRRRHRPGVLLDLPLPAAGQQHPVLPAPRPAASSRSPDLVNAMGNAGTQDLRGVEVLPYALRIIGTPSDPTLATAVSELQAWVASGAHRINRAHPGAHGNYEQSDAVRIMDAWWPLLVRAEFGRCSGSGLLAQIESQFSINDQPGHGTSGPHLGSSWDVGFYGIVQKDLRRLLRRASGGRSTGSTAGAVAGRLPRRARDSLRLAIAESPRPGVPGRRRLRGRGSDVLGLDPVPSHRRRQPAADRVGQPADLPAGGRDPGPPGRVASRTQPVAARVHCSKRL